MEGVINLNKPAGITSARAVAIVKRMLPKGTKIGHAGTLDPVATGVLLLLVGRATRLCERLMDQPKQYGAAIKLGATTPTDDPESPEEPVAAEPVSGQRIEQILPQFTGEIRQRPPVFSAMKVGGKRAYQLARTNQQIRLQPRVVHVYRLELLEYHWPVLRLLIDCGRGTYIRSLARDIGQALGVGGYVLELQRTRIGPFTVDRAVTLDQLREDGAAKYLMRPSSFVLGSSSFVF